MHTNYTNNANKGFTIIELLIVIALMVILGTIGLVNLTNKNRVDEFNATVRKMVTLLNQARDRSVTQNELNTSDPGNHWEVYFYRGTETTHLGLLACKTNQYVPVEGVPSFSLARVNQGIREIRGFFPLPASVSFDGTSTFGGVNPILCNKPAGFNQITGTSNLTAASSAIYIYLTGDPSISSTITVYPSGLVEFTGGEEVEEIPRGGGEGPE